MQVCKIGRNHVKFVTSSVIFSRNRLLPFAMSIQEPVGFLETLTPDDLQKRCQQVRPDNSHEPFCFELFRRAIVQRDEHCWSLIYQHYIKLVYRWTNDCLKEDSQIEYVNADDLVLDAFASFWKAFTAEKLQQAHSVGYVLSYLHSCVITTVLMARRKHEQKQIIHHIPIDDPVMESASADRTEQPDDSTFDAMAADSIWKSVDQCCQENQERVIARLSFVSDLEPREILALHPTLFTDVMEIYRIRRNLKNRLRRDKEMQTHWEEAG